MSVTRLADAVIAALRAVTDDEKPHFGTLRGAVAVALGRAVTPGEVRSAVERLWFSGKLEFNTLRLSASMRTEAAPAVADTDAPDEAAVAELVEQAVSVTPEASATPADEVIPDPMPIDGAGLFELLVRVGHERGLASVLKISDAIFGNSSTLHSMKAVRQPSYKTLVRSATWLGVSRPCPPSPAAFHRAKLAELTVPPGRNMTRDARIVTPRAQVQARTEGRRETCEQALDARRPGETFAECIRRIGAEVEAEDDAERATDDQSARDRDLTELATPSSVLRRAQRDWPDQCAGVRRIAADSGIQLGEAWRRVIEAGVATMMERAAI